MTRRGTNDWEFRFGYFNEPDVLRNDPPDVEDARSGSGLSSVFSFDERDSQEAFVSITGPIIPNKLFIYGIYQDRKVKVEDYESGYRELGWFLQTQTRIHFFGAKVNFDINKNHSLAFTYFSDESTRTRDSYRWHEVTHEVTRFVKRTSVDRGSENYILKYTGLLTDKLWLSALLGRNSYDYTNGNDADDT